MAVTLTCWKALSINLKTNGNLWAFLATLGLRMRQEWWPKYTEQPVDNGWFCSATLLWPEKLLFQRIKYQGARIRPREELFFYRTQNWFLELSSHQISQINWYKMDQKWILKLPKSKSTGVKIGVKAVEWPIEVEGLVTLYLNHVSIVHHSDWHQSIYLFINSDDCTY